MEIKINSMSMRVVAVREEQEYRDVAIAYLQDSWAEVPPQIYEESVDESLSSDQPFPQWYLLLKDERPIGCVGLVERELIEDVDELSPWLVALYVDEAERGRSYASLLIERVKIDTHKFGYKKLYLATEHVGYYERFEFHFLRNSRDYDGYELRIYKIEL